MAFVSSVIEKAGTFVRGNVATESTDNMSKYSPEALAKMSAASGVEIKDDESLQTANGRIGDMFRNVKTARDETLGTVKDTEKDVYGAKRTTEKEISSNAREAEGLFRQAERWCKNVSTPDYDYLKWLEDFLNLLRRVIERGLVSLFRALAACAKMFAENAIAATIGLFNVMIDNGDVLMAEEATKAVGPERVPNGKGTVQALAANAKNTPENRSALDRLSSMFTNDTTEIFTSDNKQFGNSRVYDSGKVNNMAKGNRGFVDGHITKDTRSISENVIGTWI